MWIASSLVLHSDQKCTVTIACSDVVSIMADSAYFYVNLENIIFLKFISGRTKAKKRKK